MVISRQRLFGLALPLFCAFGSGALEGENIVSQKVGVYRDNRGFDKQRIDFSVGTELKGGSGGVLDLSTVLFRVGYNEAMGERLRTSEDPDGEGKLQSQEYQLSLMQTWRKLTTTRLSAGRQNVAGRPSENFGVGVSQWLFKEQVQVSVDAFKNNSVRDVIEVLDQDSEVITPPQYYHATGGTVAIRHLASPKTILNYGYSYVATNDRPDLTSASFGVKQFVENSWSHSYHGALHADVVRIDNSGKLENTTAIGQLQGMIYQVAWLQNIGERQRARISYRQYREDEVTRVNSDRYFLGTDLASLKYVVEFDDKTFANISFPLTIDMTVHRYLSNPVNDEGVKIAANIYEIGASAKF